MLSPSNPKGDADQIKPTELKQAPRAWFDQLSQYLGFYCSKAYSSLFIYRTTNIITVFLIYVDDILVAGNNDFFVTKLLDQLGSEFAIKDLGSIHYFLGIEVRSFPGVIHLIQTKYIQDLLAKTEMLNSSSIATPMILKEKDSSSATQPVNTTLYRSIVGALQYLTFIRPDITHVVNRVCQFFNSPTQLHFKAVKHILRYLKGTQQYDLCYLHQSPISLYGFSDADWAGCPTTRRSTTGFCIYLGANFNSWCSKKQPIVARSSAGANVDPWLTLQQSSLGSPTYFKTLEFLLRNLLSFSVTI